MNRLRLHTALFTVALLFSANYVISKLGMREFAPMAFAWLRIAGAAIITYVQPVLATLFGALFFGEALGPLVIVAAALIFLGVWLAVRKPVLSAES